MIGDRPTLTATDLEKALRAGTPERYILRYHVIDGSLDLRFVHITKSIEIQSCVFTGTVDLRNAVFDNTVLFPKCVFMADFIVGDEELSNTLFKADLGFDGSIFHGSALFCGFRCEASANFKKCEFRETKFRESLLEITGKRAAVDFNGGKVGKEFCVIGSVFRGCVSFNALRCDLAGFFRDARFESREKELPVDFTASYFGTACDFTRAVFAGGALLTGVFCGLYFVVDLASFQHPEFDVSFAASRTEYFSARGTVFLGPADFSGLRCNKDAIFAPYTYEFDHPSEEQWLEDRIPQLLKTDVEKRFGSLPDSPSLAKLDGMWTVSFAHNPFIRWALSRDGNKVSVTVPTALLGPSLTLEFADIGGNLIFFYAVIKAIADFSYLSCKGSGLFHCARFVQNADFSSSLWGGDITFNCAIFESEAGFRSCRLSDFYAYGACFTGKADFANFVCHNARFDPYSVPLEAQLFDLVIEGPVTAEIRALLTQHGFHVPKNCGFKRAGVKWLVVDEEDERRAYIDFTEGVPYLKVISRFLGKDESLVFDHGQIGWILVLDGAHVKGRATFNALRCIGGIFLRNIQFGERVDLRYGTYGVNLQVEGARFHSDVQFNGISVKQELVTSGIPDGSAFTADAVFNECADFTGAKLGRLRIGSVIPFLKKKAVFAGCTFDFFDGEWRKIADQQDPTRFSLDLYLALERCLRAAGRHHEADEVYHKGKSCETLHALAQKDWGRFGWGVVFDALAGYGVRGHRLLIWCVLVVILGVVVFWPNGALRPVAETKDVALERAAQFTSLLSTEIASESCTGQAFADKLASRLTYSIGTFVPIDLKIGKVCRPALGWRQIYSAIHILAGWILVPLLVADRTGLLRKR